MMTTFSGSLLTSTIVPIPFPFSHPMLNLKGIISRKYKRLVLAMLNLTTKVEDIAIQGYYTSNISLSEIQVLNDVFLFTEKLEYWRIWWGQGEQGTPPPAHFFSFYAVFWTNLFLGLASPLRKSLQYVIQEAN